jgi:hypothetical protein
MQFDRRKREIERCSPRRVPGRGLGRDPDKNLEKDPSN